SLYVSVSAKTGNDVDLIPSIFLSNRINPSIRGAIPTCDNVKAYMKAIEAQFASSDKAMASTLMKKLSNMTLDKIKGVREHIMKIRDIASKLFALKVEISESFLVHLILKSIPLEYTPFKISYNTHKENWAINDLPTMCVYEELRLKNESIETVHFITYSKGNAKKGNIVLMKKVGLSAPMEAEGK
nr:zinc finger, CCHC-type [Tanacetum cinerariifolium]